MILTWVMVPRVRYLMAFFKTMNFTLSFINVLGSNPKENNKGFYMFPCLKQELKAFKVNFTEGQAIWSQGYQFDLNKASTNA